MPGFGHLGRLRSKQGNDRPSDWQRPVRRGRSHRLRAREDSEIRGRSGGMSGAALRDTMAIRGTMTALPCTVQPGSACAACGRGDSSVDLHRRISLAGGVVFLVFACVYFLLSDNLPPGGPFDKIGTKFFPKLLAGILGGLSLLLIALTVFVAGPRGETASSDRGDRPAFYGTLAVAFVALGLWKVIGFLATPLLMAGIMLVNGARSARVVTAVAVGGTVLLYLVFFRLFALPLPLGLVG